MASTYTLISSQVLGSSAASVTFSSIPQTYKDLVLRVSVRDDYAAENEVLDIKFNGTTTGYSYTYNVAGGGTSASRRGSSATLWRNSYTNGGSATANAFSSSEMYIPSYTASQNKPMSSINFVESNDTNASMGVMAALWQNTAAITSIAIYAVNGSYNFVTGSSFYLYGI